MAEQERKEAICFCGSALKRISIHDDECYGEQKEDTYIPCDACGKNLAKQEFVWHCMNDDAKQHWAAHDYCDECAFKRSHPRSICVCGKHLIKTHPCHPKCYGKSPVIVRCDQCNKDLSQEQRIYHCKSDKSNKHHNCVDYCIECAFGKKKLLVTKDEIIRSEKIMCPVCEGQMVTRTIQEAYGDMSFVCSAKGCHRILGRDDVGYYCANDDKEKAGLRCGYLYLYCIPCLYQDKVGIEARERAKLVDNEQTDGYPFMRRYDHRPNLEIKRRFPNPTKEDPVFPNLFGDKLPSPKRHWYYKDSKRNTKRIVFIDGKIKHLMDVSTADETFFVKFHIFYNWLASYEEVESYMKNPKSYRPKIPAVGIDNLKEYGGSGEPPKPGKPSLRAGYSVINKSPGTEYHEGVDWERESEFEIRDRNSTAWNVSPNVLGFDPRFAYFWRMKIDYTCTLVEELELPFFPFDCQDFTIHLTSKKPIHAMDIMPYPRIGYYFSMASDYSVLAEWKIRHLLIEFVRKGEEQSKTANDKATVGIHVKAERNPDSYKFHFLVLFFMAGLGLCAFAVDEEQIGERLGYAVTLLLADVATQQLIEDSMPRIPYTTFLDVYMYGCFLFLVYVTVWSSLIVLFPPWVDDMMFFVSVCLLIIFHVVIYSQFKNKRKLERSKLHMCDAELADHFDEHASSAVTQVPNCKIRWSTEREGGKSNSLVCISEHHAEDASKKAKRFPQRRQSQFMPKRHGRQISAIPSMDSDAQGYQPRHQRRLEPSPSELDVHIPQMIGMPTMKTLPMVSETDHEHQDHDHQ